ncbi:MAG: HEAT repeat domain-containing protein, partial [Humibacillus sp.]
VWAARTLLHVWSDRATAAVVNGLADPAWRVREMCAKVVARWELGAAAERCVDGLGDETPRVRAAAVRALGAVGEGEHAGAVRAALDDPDPAVRRAAECALRELTRRLDREL